MRRVLILTVVLSLFVAVPTFAKVCHPKQPIACNAVAFSVPAPASTVAPAATEPKTTEVKSNAPAKVQHQQAMVCGPWMNWHCVATTLSAAEPKPAPTQQAMVCGPWVNWHCAATTLSAGSLAATLPKPAPIQYAMVCGPWMNWHCVATTLA